MREKHADRIDNFHFSYGTFESYIRKTKTCWLWIGTTNEFGYGTYWKPKIRHPFKAHRMAYELWVGEIPQGKIVMHTCDNPPCVNPEHLKIGTIADNNRDCADKRRTPLGLKHWNAKLSDEAIKAIRDSNELQEVLAKRYGVRQSYISRIRAGISRNH